MVGEDQQEIKTERVALPPPTKRRDHHLRMFFSNFINKKKIFFVFLASINITQVGFSSSEELSPVNAFGVGLSSDPSPKHK
jgi:hypothetical protein